MSIGIKTRKMLWGRAANRCSFPECNIELVMDETETDDESIIGDEAHIVAQKEDGPRGDINFPKDKIDKYGNLVLFCKIHHKLVDDQFNTYNVEALHKMKYEHENWVREKLDYDSLKQSDDEIYAGYLETINELADVDNWNNWMSFIFSGSTSSMTKEHHNRLKELRDFLLNRVWPQRYPELEKAFLNLRLILNDFLLIFDKYKIDDNGTEWWRTEKFYQIREYDEERYDMLADRFDYHEGLINDFACELTKAFNYIFELVRKFLIRSYRIKEGVLLITTGPTMELKYITYRLEYTDEEKETLPYNNLREFMSIREARTLHFGEGISDNYLGI